MSQHSEASFWHFSLCFKQEFNGIYLVHFSHKLNWWEFMWFPFFLQSWNGEVSRHTGHANLGKTWGLSDTSLLSSWHTTGCPKSLASTVLQLITYVLLGGWDKPVGHFALAFHSRYDGLHVDHRLSDQEGVGESLEYPLSIGTTELSMVTRQHLPSEIKYVKANIPVFLTDQRTLQHCQPGRYEESNRHTHKYFSSFFCNRQSGGL